MPLRRLILFGVTVITADVQPVGGWGLRDWTQLDDRSGAGRAVSVPEIASVTEEPY